MKVYSDEFQRQFVLQVDDLNYGIEVSLGG